MNCGLIPKFPPSGRDFPEYRLLVAVDEGVAADKSLKSKGSSIPTPPAPAPPPPPPSPGAEDKDGTASSPSPPPLGEWEGGDGTRSSSICSWCIRSPSKSDAIIGSSSAAAGMVKSMLKVLLGPEGGRAAVSLCGLYGYISVSRNKRRLFFFTANTDPMKFLPTDLTGLYVEEKKGGEGENTHGWGYLGRRVRGPVRKTHSRLESAHLFQTGR